MIVLIPDHFLSVYFIYNKSLFLKAVNEFSTLNLAFIVKFCQRGGLLPHDWIIAKKQHTNQEILYFFGYKTLISVTKQSQTILHMRET